MGLQKPRGDRPFFQLDPNSHHVTTRRTMSDVWPLFNSVEAESVVNALRRWQSAFSSNQNRKQAPSIIDPYVRLVLDRVLPADVEARLCREPLDR